MDFHSNETNDNLHTNDVANFHRHHVQPAPVAVLRPNVHINHQNTIFGNTRDWEDSSGDIIEVFEDLDSPRPIYRRANMQPERRSVFGGVLSCLRGLFSCFRPSSIQPMPVVFHANRQDIIQPSIHNSAIDDSIDVESLSRFYLTHTQNRIQRNRPGILSRIQHYITVRYAQPISTDLRNVNVNPNRQAMYRVDSI